MGSLNYDNIDFEEFEALSKDVMGRMLSKKLERFGTGPDGGIDLTDDVCNPTVIVQCKKYNSPSQFVAVMREEATKMDAYKGTLKEYYAFTSADLKPEHVKSVRNLFSNYMDSDDHVIYNVKLEDFFNKKENADIIEKHQKLFISLPDWYKKDDLLDKHVITLTVQMEKGAMALSPDSVEQLKEYSLNYEELSRKELVVNLKLDNFDEMAKLIIRDDIINDPEHGYDFALQEARQRMMGRFESFKTSMEHAIKLMLKNTRGVIPVDMYHELFVNKYGYKNYVYLNEYNVERYYGEAYYWVTETVEIVNTVLTGRINVQANMINEYYGIKGFTKMDARRIFEFTSNISRERREMFTEYDDIHATYEFTAEDQVYQIYPAMYLYVGELMAGKLNYGSLDGVDFNRLVIPLSYHIGLA